MKIAKVEFDSYLDTREVAEGVSRGLQDFTVFIHTEDKTYEVIIKAGFLTDFASVPRIPFAYLLFGGLGNYPAYLHDGLYAKGQPVTVVDFDTQQPYEYDRLFADEAFYLGLLERGIPTWKAKMMYWGVRWKGGQYYKADTNEWQRKYAEA